MSNEPQQNKPRNDDQQTEALNDQEKDVWEDILNTDTYTKHVRIESPHLSDNVVEQDEEFNYRSNLKLRPENID